MKLVLIFIAFLVSLFVSPVMAETLTISTFEGHPYITIGVERVMREAYHRLGREIEIKKIPNPRALLWANAGKFDAELFRKKDGIEEKYPNLIKVPVCIHTEELVVFTKKVRSTITDWESLLPYSVGFAHGFKAIEVNLLSGTHFETVSTMEQAFRKLNAGRTDVVIDLRSNGLLVIKRLGFKDIRILEAPLERVDSYHYLHVKNRHLLGPLTEVLMDMQREGVITDIHREVVRQLSE